MDDLFDDATLMLAADAVAELRLLCPFELSPLVGARLLAVCVSTLATYRTLREDAYPELIDDVAAACVQHLADRMPPPCKEPPLDARRRMTELCVRMIRRYAAELARRN